MITQIRDFYNTYGYFHIKAWCMHILVVLCLILMPIKYFIWSIGVYIIFMPLSQTIAHEYICHEYVQPRNKLIEFISFLLFYGLGGRTTGAKRAYHVSHHRFWKTPELDPPQQKMKGVSFWQYVLNFQKPVAQNIQTVHSSLLENNIFVKTMDPHAEKIFWIFHIILFAVLPVEWFVIITIYYIWIGTIVFGIHDQLFHRDTNAQDHSWYLPIFGNQAWHVKHHEEYKKIYYGPGIVKWFNPAMYIQKIFFKPTKQCLV